MDVDKGIDLISLCIPCMNRTYALRKALPLIVDAANFSPPIEIVIVDYSSKDDLQEYLSEVSKWNLVEGNFFTFRFLKGKEYYNSAHCRNLCVMASRGNYIIQLSAEALPKKEAFSYLREKITESNPDWMCESSSGRYIVCKRSEFVDSGGYDERFYAYAPEDRDICARLHRRGGKFLTFPNSLIGEIPTPNSEKLKNLDRSQFTEEGLWIKRQMLRAMHKIYKENCDQEVMVANTKGWGEWI